MTGRPTWKRRSPWPAWRWPTASPTSSAPPTPTTSTSSIPPSTRNGSQPCGHVSQAEAIPLTLGLGCDLHLSYENIQTACADPARFSINGGSYLLVELPNYGLSPRLAETFYELQLAKLTPILTHPERNRTLQAGPAQMLPWLRGGLLVQVTADSVLGHMGKHAEALAHRLLADRWVHFLATDAHSAQVRPPRMREAHALVGK